MDTVTVDVPADALALLANSALGDRPPAEQVARVLAIHLFQSGTISVGKAAELAGQHRAEFEQLLRRVGAPVVRYDEADYERDLAGFEAAKNSAASR